MLTFETADQKEVRRFRIAQFNGRTATVRSGGSTVTGHVRSVLESKSSTPVLWTITIVPVEPTITADPLRPTPRVRAFAEDFYSEAGPPGVARFRASIDKSASELGSAKPRPDDSVPSTHGARAASPSVIRKSKPSGLSRG